MTAPGIFSRRYKSIADISFHLSYIRLPTRDCAGVHVSPPYSVAGHFCILRGVLLYFDIHCFITEESDNLYHSNQPACAMRVTSKSKFRCLARYRQSYVHDTLYCLCILSSHLCRFNSLLLGHKEFYFG